MRVAYENAWISVRHDEVLRPDGEPGIYGVVQFRNRAMAIVPIHDDGSTWLVGQYRYTIDQYSWEVPEGGVPHGENLEVGARRELEEEVGLVADRVFAVGGPLHLSNSVSDEVAHVMIAVGLREGPPRPEGTEQLRQVRLPLARVVELVDEGVITDALSVVAVQRASQWWARNQPGSA
jgi:8-oxo-dGTP pyrophosphatase MutT (NUDIX family)